jgi:hypothetical protein
MHVPCCPGAVSRSSQRRQQGRGGRRPRLLFAPWSKYSRILSAGIARRVPVCSYYPAVALPQEISERLFILCDTTIEGEPENVRAIMAEMSRDELETVLAEAATKLVDASFRAEKEIERFQRRLAGRRKPS